MELFDFQKDAITTIVGRGTKSSYLGYEMGLGKTIIAIETAKKRKVKRLLILCPAIGRLTWEKELKRWWPEMPVTVVTGWQDMVKLSGEGVFVLAYSSISMSKTGGYDYTAALKKIIDARPMDMTVLDEAHALKNPGAIRTKSVLHTLKPGLGWCLPMSGTPAPNHAGELYPILKTIFPDAITDQFTGRVLNRFEYEARYCNVVDKWFGGRSVRTIDGSKNLPDLRQRLASFFLRKRKKDVLKELPDMMFDSFPIAAPFAPAGHTNWAKMDDDEFLKTLSSGVEPHVATIRRELGEAKVEGAVEAVEDYLDNCTRKALVFAHHTNVIDGLMKGLADRNPVRIDGRDNPAARQKAIDTFLTNDKCRVFVGQIQAAGTTITLVGPQCDVSDVFFVEADFSPGNNVQAASRIHRIGQKNAVQVWFLTAHGTFDDRIADILARKSRDFKVLFD